MTVTVRTTCYGAPAYEALAEVVGNLKGDDPLAPVMLIVPGERVGIAARRALARGPTPGTPASPRCGSSPCGGSPKSWPGMR